MAGPLPTPSDALRAALRLPRASEPVASWLFAPCDDDRTTLAPALFERALPLVSHSHFTPSPSASPSIRAAPPATVYFVVLIPLRVLGPLTLGLTFHVGLPAADALFPLADVLHSKFALIGRFAFDADAQQLLIYIPDFTDNYAHLGLVGRTPTRHRTMQFVSLPKKMNAQNPSTLPAHAVGATFLSQAPADPADEPPARAPRDAVDDGSCSHCSSNGARAPSDIRPPPPTISLVAQGTYVVDTSPPRRRRRRRRQQQRWEGSGGGTAVEGGGGGHEPEMLQMRSERDPELLVAASGLLGAFMAGRFRACTVTRDVPGCPDGSAPRAVGSMRSETWRGEGGEADMLRKLAARTYYASALSVSNDMRLVFGGGDAEEEDIEG